MILALTTPHWQPILHFALKPQIFLLKGKQLAIDENKGAIPKGSSDTIRNQTTAFRSRTFTIFKWAVLFFALGLLLSTVAIRIVVSMVVGGRPIPFNLKFQLPIKSEVKSKSLN